LEKEAAAIFSKVMQEVPFVRLERLERGKKLRPGTVFHPDFFAPLWITGRRKIIIVEVKNNGQPRFARDAANSLYRLCQFEPGAYGIFMAPYISPVSAQILKAQGFGYLDFSGNCFISFDGVFIKRDSVPNLFYQKRELRKLYTESAPGLCF